MAIFTSYARVVEPDGSAMPVRTALGLINQVLSEVLDEQQGDFDPDTRWALKWFEQYAMEEGPSGVAEQLCTTYNVSLRGLERGGIIKLSHGKTQLLERRELPDEWDPVADDDVSVWEATQHLAKRLDENGEAGAASLLRRLGGLGDTARELAYLLFSICERRKRPKEALVYNALVTSWPEMARLATEEHGGDQQALL